MEDSDFGFKTRKAHPYERANFLSRLLFIWGFPLFSKGFRKELGEKDLYQPLRQLESKKLGDEIEKEWNKEKNRYLQPSLWKILFRLHWFKLFVLGIICFFSALVVKTTQPLFIGYILTYYIPNQTSMQFDDVIFYAIFLIILNFVSILLYHQFLLEAQSLGVKMRIATSSLIYRKALKLNSNSFMETTAGQIVNLLSNDTRRFETLIMFIHTIWLAPLEIILILYLLYANLGHTALIGATVLVIYFPIQSYVPRKIAKFRQQTASNTDERIKTMNEIISGIKMIKMCAWETPLTQLIQKIRSKEINKLKWTLFMKALNKSISEFLSRLAVFICIIVYVFLGNNLEARYVFVAISFYTNLRMILTTFIPMTISSITETNVSVKRLQKFLNCPEIIIKETLADEEDVRVILKDASAGWDLSTNILNNINFEARNQQLTAIIGPVGSGKTTLLNVILRELPLSKGTLEVQGTVSYASQEPWLFSGTIRQNILFGQTIDLQKYQDVIKICSLSPDLEKFPYGDQSSVGEKGVILSGGQKARINLARAIYKNADIYLLDDPLSAVDPQVGRELFQNCILGYLKNKCVILVTHQIQYLNLANKIFLIENGTITTSGSFSQVQNTAKDFIESFDNNSKQLGDENNEGDDKTIPISFVEKPKQTGEQMKTGKVEFSNYIKYFKAGGGFFITFTIFLIYIFTQITLSGSDYFLTFWTNLEQDKNISERNLEINTTQITPTPFGGNLETFNRFFITENCIYIYTALIALIITFNFLSISFYSFCMKASENLHNNMFKTILKAPLRFFNTNNSGQILNRFSKDLGSVDEMLPNSLNDSLQIFLSVIASTFLMIYINLWTLIPTILIFGLFYIYRNIYLATSGNLKRMDGTTKSPVIAHLNASLQGLTTIRAFKNEKILRNEFDSHQNLHTSANYMFICSNRVFGYWLDLNCAIFTALVILNVLLFDPEKYGGDIGLVITQSMALTRMLQLGIRQSSELENQITSVERVLEYTTINPEQDNGDSSLKSFKQGKIEFKSVFMKYSHAHPYVLNNISFTIQPAEKIGIVGRTGAGKSSLISALFRLTNFDGVITIDSIDIKQIPLQQLRSKISVIPQEPALFSGTLRKNLDPFDEYEDSKLWAAINEVKLREVFDNEGLCSKITEGGTNLSVGQKQLICLARALIKDNAILILDEATANIDQVTDKLIQKTIKEKFKQCTVITIAHRLNTILDSDKILVLNNGEVVEFDKPEQLLNNPNGLFYQLYQINK